MKTATVPAIGALVLFCAACGGGKSGGPTTVYVNPPTRTVVVPSSSMEATLHCAQPGTGCEATVADGVVVQPIGESGLKRGNIIVFKTPPLAAVRCGAGGRFIKRVVALPGETWEERNGTIYINGRKLNEPYVRPDRRDTRTLPARKIPPGYYFFMGDNRVQSCDSREWGAAPRANIIGRVAKIIRSRWKALPRAARCTRGAPTG